MVERRSDKGWRFGFDGALYMLSVWKQKDGMNVSAESMVERRGYRCKDDYDGYPFTML